MLEERFYSTPKTRVRKRVRDNDGNPLLEPINTDLLRYEGKEVETIPRPSMDFLHIIKFYKSLETQILTRSNELIVEELKLGQFYSVCSNLIQGLTTLLLSLDRLEPQKKKRILTYVFSAIVIYRQFKVKSIPDLQTLTAPYGGEDLDTLRNIFSLDRLKKFLLKRVPEDVLKKEIFLKIYSGNASSPNSLSSSSKILEDV